MPSPDRKDLGVFYPFMGHACHIPVVEVDIKTGGVTFLSYAAIHDCGTLVNPRSLSGHIQGGTAQGIGTALHEEFVYDELGAAPHGQLSGLPHPHLRRGPASSPWATTRRPPRGPRTASREVARVAA